MRLAKSPVMLGRWLSFSLLITVLLLAMASCYEAAEPDCEEGNCDLIENFDLYTPGNRYGWGGQDEYLDEIQPILAKRCVVCHGCGDSPCQLKLSSYEAVVRGANPENVFQMTLLSQEPNRLKDGRVSLADGNIDHEGTESRWRDREFYSVLRSKGSDALMSKLLTASAALGRKREDVAGNGAHALYESGLKDREFQCVGADNVGDLHGSDLEARAMPFGLQPLEDGDYQKVMDWIEGGALGPDIASQKLLRAPRNPAEIAKWETFLNGGIAEQLDLKRYLMARYLYEHMFSSHIRFEASPGEFYELVRSATGANEAIDEIVTPYIMDDPNVERVYYRLRKVDAVIVRKNHTVWDLDDGALNRYRELFLEGRTGDVVLDYEVTSDPGYTSLQKDGDHNPFRYFQQIPAAIRSQFLIENARDLVDLIVKGDVCTGSSATYAIRDHFSVWFLKPSSDPSTHQLQTIVEGDDAWDLNPFALHSTSESEDEAAYQDALERQMRLLHPVGLSLDDVWTGDEGEANANSWLSVFRHEKSATVEWGAPGGVPETAWLMSYGNFERTFYNLHVNYLAWAGAIDQIQTWTYMSNIRTEAEDLWLSLLPKQHRAEVRERWSKGFESSFLFDVLAAYKEGRMMSLQPNSALGLKGTDGRDTAQFYMNDEPSIRDVFEILVAEGAAQPRGFGGTLNRTNVWEDSVIGPITSFESFEKGLSKLSGVYEDFASILPNLTVLRVSDRDGNSRLYTLVANRGYRNHDVEVGADLARACERDYLSVFEGVVGNYPELFIDVSMGRATALLQDMQKLRHASKSGEGRLTWHSFIHRYADEGVVITRDSFQFWPFVDQLHRFLVEGPGQEPSEAGILDLSEYFWVQGAHPGAECE